MLKEKQHINTLCTRPLKSPEGNELKKTFVQIVIFEKVGVLPIRIVKSNISSVGSSESLTSLVSLNLAKGQRSKR